MELNEYQKGWRYVVWVGGIDDAFVHYQDALDNYNSWTKQGYDDVILSKLNEDDTEEIIINENYQEPRGLEIVRCKNGVGEWEISPLHETFDTREEAERKLKELTSH